MDGLGQTGGQPDISFPNFGDQMYLPCEFPQYMFPVPDYSYFQQIPPFYPDDLFKQMQQFQHPEQMFSEMQMLMDHSQFMDEDELHKFYQNPFELFSMIQGQFQDQSEDESETEESQEVVVKEKKVKPVKQRVIKQKKAVKPVIQSEKEFPPTIPKAVSAPTATLRVKNQIGTLTPKEREEKIRKFLEKRKMRNFKKRISYICRKRVADNRMRVKGRFITKSQAESMQVSTSLSDTLKKPAAKKLGKLGKQS